MRFVRLNGAQRGLKRKRATRNRMVCRIMAQNPRMTSYEALAEANRRLNMKGVK